MKNNYLTWINKNIIFLTSGIAIIIIIGSAWITIKNIRQEHERNIEVYLTTVIETVHQGFHSWKERHSANAQIWAQEVLPATKELLSEPSVSGFPKSSPALNKIREMLKPLLITDNYEGFSIIGPGNINLASSHDENIGKKNLLVEQPELLQKIWSGETVLSLPMHSDVPLPDKNGILTEKRITMFIGTPVTDESGKVIAIFALRINPYKDFTKIFNRGRIGKTGETYAIDRNGLMLTHSRFAGELIKTGLNEFYDNEILQLKVTVPQDKKDNSNEKDISYNSGLTLAAQGISEGKTGGNLKGYPNCRGINVVGVWIWNEEENMGIVIEQDVSEAYNNYIVTQTAILFLVLLITGLIIGLAIQFYLMRKKLLISEEHFRLLFENSPLPIYQTTPAGKILAANPALLEMLEYCSVEELQERNLEKEGYSKKSGITRKQFVEMIERDGFVKGLEELWETKSGKLIPIREYARAVRNDNGTTLFYEGTAEDITERKQAEKIIAQQSRELETLLEISHDLTKTFNLEIILQATVDSAVKILQLDSSAFYMVRGEDLYLAATTPPLPPDFPEPFRNAFLADHPHIVKALASKSTVAVPDTSKVSLSSAERKICEVRGLQSLLHTPVIADNKVLGILILGTVGQPKEYSAYHINLCQTLANHAAIAITNSKLYESTQKYGLELEQQIDERMKIEESLLESEKKFRTVIESNPAAILIVQDERIVFVNRAAVSMTGYNYNELTGMHFLEPVHPDFRDLVMENARKRIAGLPVPMRYEIKLITKGGESRWLDFSPQLMNSYDGKPAIMAMGMDITERKHAEEILLLKYESEKIVAEASSNFINLPPGKLDETVENTLGRIGRFVKVDRAYVFLFSKDNTIMDNTHEWCADGIEPQIDHLKGLHSKIFPWWMEKLNGNETILIPQISDLPPEASAEKEILQEQDVQSLIVVPLIHGKNSIGFMGFDSVQKQRTWNPDEIVLLKLIGETISNAIIRTNTEKTLLETNTLLERMFQSTEYMLAYLDTSFNFIRVNNAYAEKDGFTTDYYTGKNHFELYPNKENEEIFKKVVESKEPFNTHAKPFVNPLRPERGITYWDWMLTPVKNESGLVNGLLFSLNDVTEQKKAEEKLRLSREQFVLAVDGSNDGIWDWEIVSNKVYFSPRWKNMLGFDDGELENNFSTWENLLHPDDRDPAFHKIQSYFNKKIAEYSVEFRMQHKDGSYRWILSRGKALWDETGKPIRMAGSHTDITERKDAEKNIRILNQNLELRVTERTLELQKIRKRLEFLLTSSPVIIYTSAAKPPFGATYIGENVKALTGYKPSQFVENPNFWASKIHPEDTPRVFDELKHLFDKGHHTHEYRFMFADGNYYWMRDELLIVKDRNGNPVELLGYWININDRKKAEGNLAISEARFRDVALSSSDFVWEVDANGYYIFCSGRVVDVLGYSCDEIIGKTPFEFMPPDEARRIGLIFQEIASNKEPIIDLENLNISKDGREVLLLTNGVPVLDDKGNLLGYRGIDKDITLQKQAEEEYRTILQTALDGFWITDNQGKLLIVNDAYCKMSGYTREELLTKRIPDLEAVEKPEETAQHIQKIIATGYDRFETKHRRKDGSVIDVQISVQFSNIRGGIFIVFIQDITERKNAEKELKKAKTDAESANKAKSEFLANMSHEIRTPMNSIIGFSQLLKFSVKEKKQLSQLESIHGSANNLLKIINDILDLSVIEAGKLNIQNESVNLYHIINDIENIFSLKLKEKGLSLITEKRDDTKIKVNIMIDEVRLRQILFNLVGNAIKFTEKGYVKLIVSEMPKAGNNNRIDLQILVEDSGIGIPENEQEGIFEAFRQQEGQSTSKYGGTGLGLTISRRLAQAMGGNIKVKSTLGKGSVFNLTIPDVEIVKRRTLKPKDEIFNPASVSFEPAKVLIVDDNQSNRELIVDLLGNTPLTLFEAQNGKEALLIAARELPDIILMDLKMPEMDGYQATRILKSEQTTKHIPVIAISASVNLNIENKSKTEIFNDYLLKPVYFTELFNTLKNYLKYISEGETQGRQDVTNIKITESERKRLPELITALTEEFLPYYEKVRDNQIMDEIEKFGRDLVLLGEKQKMEFIIHLGNEIIQNAKNFEVEKLEKILQMFPDLVNRLKSMK